MSQSALNSTMSIPSGTQVYVSKLHGASTSGEYRINLPPSPRNWLDTIASLHQCFRANGTTIHLDTFLRTIRVYLSIDGFLAELNSHSICWSLRENDHLVVSFSESPTSDLHGLTPQESMRETEKHETKFTGEWSTIDSAKYSELSVDYSVVAAPRRNSSDATRKEGVTKRNRSISAKIKAIKLLLEYGVIGPADRDTLWHLMMTNRSPALENALFTFQETGNAEQFLTQWHQYQITALKNDSNALNYSYTDSIIQAFDDTMIGPQPLESFAASSSTRLNELDIPQNHQLSDSNPNLTSQVCDSSQYVYATTDTWCQNKSIPNAYTGKQSIVANQVNAPQYGMTGFSNYYGTRPNDWYSLTATSSLVCMEPSYAVSALSLENVPDDLETKRPFPIGTGKSGDTIPKPYSQEEKKAKIARWLKKREHRNWSNKPSYPLRHTIAMSRRRGEDGRFVPKDKNNRSDKSNSTLFRSSQ
uniref:Uncharacterized protein AlNc14C41G3538 n=1 Tax=Albugo laibachii Nc14 TaxID=890382 RepID=F0W9T4_9STRA|nr:conserved hypothetical protein [Albugo laibachii Nc14]|eukprot:CCA17902.1 conserved hypothetical protein [Albugo laibachii Nc14]